MQRKRRATAIRAGGCRGTRLGVAVCMLKEIFRSLDTVDRQRCRRTCQLWETLLTSAELCTEVRVSRQRPSQRIQWDGDYLVYACFFKHIMANTFTNSLCNIPGTEDAKGDMGGLDAAMEQLVKEVSNDMGIRMERFILQQPQRTIVIRHSGMERWNLTALAAVIAALLARRMSCWDRMVLKE
ncbi:uncharacterized protein LOC129597439 isoform X1 [Paramacrobiotus metropolitanus]|uniref:uncharacterized protein LOC129597439 isoform X1 n=1 Tax=Paramacrobiotus metropolitanus TaxID=2943436 RepID=UPI0024459317|nr:uncharacterized protein LOC129597439 isoform X1 [Paramacrobiotus metropolitanus]